jgi:hypothetical protein
MTRKPARPRQRYNAAHLKNGSELDKFVVIHPTAEWVQEGGSFTNRVRYGWFVEDGLDQPI